MAHFDIRASIVGMNVITIPKKIAGRGDLVVLPRREYELLLTSRRKVEDIDSAIDTGLSEYKAGKYKGPFSPREARAYLRISHRGTKIR